MEDTPIVSAESKEIKKDNGTQDVVIKVPTIQIKGEQLWPQVYIQFVKAT